MVNQIKKSIIGLMMFFICFASSASSNILKGFSCVGDPNRYDLRPYTFSLVSIGNKRAVYLYSLPNHNNMLWASVAKIQQKENNYVITEEDPQGWNFFEIVIYGVSEIRPGISNNFVIHTIPIGKTQPVVSRTGTCSPEY